MFAPKVIMQKILPSPIKYKDTIRVRVAQGVNTVIKINARAWQMVVNLVLLAGFLIWKQSAQLPLVLRIAKPVLQVNGVT